MLQRLQLQQYQQSAPRPGLHPPRLPPAAVRPDALAVKIAKIRQQIVALHLQIRQVVRQQQLLSAAAAVHGAATDSAPAFDAASRDLARDFSGAVMMHDDWKAPPDSVASGGVAPDLPHSVVTQEAWPGWPMSLLNTAPPPPQVSDGAAVSSGTASALDIEEFIPGKPWQGPTIRSADDDPFITPGGASSSVGVDEKMQPGSSVSQHPSSNSGWTGAARDEGPVIDRGTAGRAPPGLVPSGPWLQQQPAFNRSTSWTPQSSYGELPLALTPCVLK